MNPEEFADHLRFLANTPKVLSDLLQGLSDSEIRAKFSDDEFSALENVCHLSDIESEGYVVRIRRILSEDEPRLPDVNGTQLAVERNYNQQDVQLALRSFSDARAGNVATLRGLEMGQLERKGELEGVGTVSLAQLLRTLCEHDESHLGDVRSLKDRLYAQRHKC